MNTPVIVSGACGFVGRRLVAALAERKCPVFAVDLKSVDFKKYFPAVPNTVTFIETDFTKEKDVRAFADRVPPGCVLVHLGGYILKNVSGSDAYEPAHAIDVNIRGSYTLVQGLLPKLNSVCAASTLDVYGIPQFLPITEAHPAAPQTFYAASKLAMEGFLQLLLENVRPLAILRFSHVYGEGDPHAKVLQSFVQAVNHGTAPVIYGDGADLRDYIHVNDVVEAIVRAITIRPCGIFNVASGQSHSLKQLAESIIRLSGKGLEPEFRPRRHPRKDYVFDISKLRNELRAEPKVSLEEGIKEMLL